MGEAEEGEEPAEDRRDVLVCAPHPAGRASCPQKLRTGSHGDRGTA